MIFLRHTHFNNPLSIAGIAAAVLAGMFHISLFLMDILGRIHNPYLNIWLHMVLPPIVVVGFFLALYGAWRRKRLIASGKWKGQPAGRSFQTRSVLIGSAVVIVLLVPFVAVTSYEGYHFTDSVEFCGRLCHEPMKPSYTAYQYSPHARVDCASCHIGEGASWFVRSKLSGTRQVFATIFDTYHRPFKTPLENLRPARETCERCHWPDKFFGDRVVERPHRASDENNTSRPLTMVLHTGGGDVEMGPVSGIHWHVSSHQKTEYVSVDGRKKVIPWVKVTTEAGARVYRSDGLPADAPPPEGEHRVMDCIDCHNMPSHRYRTPDEILNRLFAVGKLDPTFPFLKREAARLMAAPHKDTASAREAIAGGLRSFYAGEYPEIEKTRGQELEGAIDAVIQAFERNIFPEMRTDWRAHPDFIGHKYTAGCDRCHDGRHAASDGSVIVKDCAACHDFLERREVEGEAALVRGKYSHPYPLEKAHADLACHACHDGGPTPPPTCTGCHSDISGFIAGALPILPGVTGKPDAMADDLECSDCHDGPRSFGADEIVPMCVDCHDEEYGPVTEKLLADLAASARKARAAAESAGNGPGATGGSSTDARALEALDLLERIRPLHNAEYALEVYRKMSGEAEDPER